jgi:hypothetical protein
MYIYANISEDEENIQMGYPCTGKDVSKVYKGSTIAG